MTQARTLILEIALPDFMCDEYDFDDPEMGEILREFCEGNLNPEGLAEAALEDAGLTSPRINLAILTGSKDGNFVERVKGQFLGARIVTREPSHELSDDTRLDEMDDHVG